MHLEAPTARRQSEEASASNASCYTLEVYSYSESKWGGGGGGGGAGEAKLINSPRPPFKNKQLVTTEAGNPSMQMMQLAIGWR